MANALLSNSKTEHAEIEDIEETIERAKKICQKLEHRSKDENDTKLKTILEDIIEKLNIAMCESIILEETKTSVPSLNGPNENEVVIQKAVKIDSLESFKKPKVPCKMNYKDSIQIRQKSA